MEHSASSRLAGCDKNSEAERLLALEKINCRRMFFSRQAAKVAKEKHEYFCNGFARLLPFSSAFHDSSRLILAIARLTRNYASRVYSDPLAGRGPCGRPPWLGNQFPIRGADGHKGRALQMANTTHERPKVSLHALSLRRNNSAARLSLRLCEKTLCGSISSAALRENIYATARIDLHHSKSFICFC